MAGFFDGGRNKFGNLQRKLNQKVNSNYDSLLIKNSQAIGYIENELRKRGNSNTLEPEGDPYMEMAIALSDTTSSYRSSVLSFFQLDYDVKVEKLMDMAANGEMEFVLENITDDIIVYDENNYFCHPADIRKAIHRKDGINSKKDSYIKEDQLMAEYTDAFESIYSAWGFDNGISAWQWVYEYLITGRLAFEIIYDDIDNPKRIVGFKELNPSSIYPNYTMDEGGNPILTWVQRDSSNQLRTLSDNQIIYLQYSSHHKTKRISFLERLVRSFNMLRTVENSKVMWHLMYGAVRLKTKVPVGKKSYHRGFESLAEYKNAFKEDITFNADTGEVSVFGNPKIQYFKNYMIPQGSDGSGIDIETLKFDGPDLQQDVLLQYFYKKMKIDSKLPFSRWDYDSGGGSYLQSPDSVTREEYEYSKFISRLRTGIAEIMTKPIYIQMCLNNKAISNDTVIKNAIGIQFNDDKIFEKAKLAQILTANADTVSKLAQIKIGEESVFDMEFLCKKLMNFTEDDYKENEKIKADKKIKKDKFGGGSFGESIGSQPEAASGPEGGGGDMGGGGGDLGGGQAQMGGQAQLGGQGQLQGGGQGQGQGMQGQAGGQGGQSQGGGQGQGGQLQI